MQSILRILKVNEERTGVKDGRPWSMQDAEVMLLKETGEIDQVGVLQIPKDLRGKVVPGDFIGSFALKADMASRRIVTQLVGLQPYSVASPRVTSRAIPNP